MAGTVINRGNHHWELRISCGYDAKGRQIRKTKRIQAPSLRAAKKQLETFYWEVMQNDRAEQQASAKNMTFGELAEVWEKRHNNRLALTTRVTQKTLLEDRIMDFFKGIPIQKITSDMVMEFVEKLRRTHLNRLCHRGNGFLSDTMVHKNYKLVNHILSKAVEWKFLAKNPCDEIPKGERPKPAYQHYPIWQEDALERFLQRIESLPDSPALLKNKTMFYIALMSGARKGEFSALTWKDIHWDEHSIDIDKAQKYIDSKNVEVSKPKTPESVRSLYVDEYILGLLRRHKENQDKYLAWKHYENPHGYVFLAVRLRHGEVVPVSASCLYIWLNKICEENSLPHITVHSLRHMAATYALANCSPLTSVQAMLGHVNVRTTSIYLHPLDAQRKQTAAVLSDRLKRLRNKEVKE